MELNEAKNPSGSGQKLEAVESRNGAVTFSICFYFWKTLGVWAFEVDVLEDEQVWLSRVCELDVVVRQVSLNAEAVRAFGLFGISVEEQELTKGVGCLDTLDDVRDYTNSQPGFQWAQAERTKRHNLAS